MFCFELLEPGCYYLVQLKENDPLVLLQVKVVSETSMYLVKYRDVTEYEWVKKTDEIYDIVELLSDEVAEKWLQVYNNNDYNFEEDD